MRFMVQVRATPETEAGIMPEPEILEAMGAFNEELIKGGHMLAGEGLKDSSKGARLTWKDGKVAVIDGPFAETKELIAGFWLVDFPSKEAVIEAFKRCPAPMGNGEGTLEIRQVFESADFEGLASAELLEKEDAFRREHGQAATH
jgi:hypothetical protein